MKIIYTNISPITNSYTNINHIFYLKNQKPQKVYLCVWDSFVFEHPVFEGVILCHSAMQVDFSCFREGE